MTNTHPIQSLRAQLLTIGLFSGGIFLAGTINSWISAQTLSRAADQVHDLSQVQKAHQHADMLHNAIGVAVLAGVLAGQQADEAGLAATRAAVLALQSELSDHNRRAQVGWSEATGTAFPPVAVDAYLLLAGAVIDESYTTGLSPPPSLPAFFAESERVRSALHAITEYTIAPAVERARGEAAHTSAATTLHIWGFAGFASLILGGLLVRHSRKVLRDLAQVQGVAQRMTRGDLSARNEGGSVAEIAELGMAFNELADSLKRHVGRAEGEAELANFTTQLNEAMDVVDTQAEVMSVVQRAFLRVSANHPVELLLADSSKAHLERAAAHPTRGGGCCPVESPAACMAVRRGTRLAFPSSEALNACPKLRGRPAGPVAAVCVPVSFMGVPIGVIHATMPEHQLPPVEYGNRLKLVAMQVGSRLGTIRILEQRQLQASTDGLTGLLNRRAFTERFREVATRGQAFCLAIADLDHFKKLNDTFGHEAGDRALRRFADLLGTVLPAGAVPARMGGEEFLILFPDLDLRDAFGALEVLRMALHEPGSPSFTASFGLVDQSMGRTLDDLVRVADQALYDSKEGGRDRVTIADVGAGFRQRDAEPQYGVGLKAAG